MSAQLDLTKFKTSSIGTTVDSIDLVDIDFKYTWIGWFFITFFGTTRLPRKVSFTCKQTGELFEVLENQKLIEHFMLFRRH